MRVRLFQPSAHRDDEANARRCPTPTARSAVASGRRLHRLRSLHSPGTRNGEGDVNRPLRERRAKLRSIRGVSHQPRCDESWDALVRRPDQSSQTTRQGHTARWVEPCLYRWFHGTIGDEGSARCGVNRGVAPFFTPHQRQRRPCPWSSATPRHPVRLVL